MWFLQRGSTTNFRRNNTLANERQVCYQQSYFGISSFFITKFLKASCLEMSSVCKDSRIICRTAVSNEVQPLFSNQWIELQLHHLFSHKQDVLGVPG